MPKVIALLRGINVGGNKKIAMAELREAFGDWGFSDVATVLNSGNVIFESGRRKVTPPLIEANIRKTFGFDVGVILRSVVELQKIVDSRPFKGRRVDENTRQ